MPQNPTAIRLTKENVHLISSMLDIDRELVDEKWAVNSNEVGAIYYVRDIIQDSELKPYVIYTEQEFRDAFVMLPEGINVQFVPVRPKV